MSNRHIKTVYCIIYLELEIFLHLYRPPSKLGFLSVQLPTSVLVDYYGLAIRLYLRSISESISVTMLWLSCWHGISIQRISISFILRLTHWGRVTHICVSYLTIIGWNNGLSPGRRQAIILTNAGIVLIGPLGTNISEILIEILTFSFKKMHFKMSSGKWRPSCLGLNLSASHLSLPRSTCYRKIAPGWIAFVSAVWQDTHIGRRIDTMPWRFDSRIHNKWNFMPLWNKTKFEGIRSTDWQS